MQTTSLIAPAPEATHSIFRGDIQGLRAVAVAMVVLYHAGYGAPGGFIGVDVFFVVSGYVITRILHRELATNGHIDLRRFYLRRIRRLLPALAVVLTFTLLAGMLLAPFGAQRITAHTGAAAALVNANNYLALAGTDGGYFGVGADKNALLHTWSLSAEEQFYLVFPGLLALTWWAARRPGRPPRRVLTGMLGVTGLCSFALSLAQTHGRFGLLGNPFRLAFYTAPARAWEFIAGAVLAIAAPHLTRFTTRTATAAALAGGTLLVYGVAAFDKTTPFPGTAALVPVIGTTLLLTAGERPGANPVNNLLGRPRLQRLGDLSYSWYLWHWPCIVFATALWPTHHWVSLAAAGLSLAPAWLSLHLIENPIRFTPHPTATRTIALGAACALIPLAAATGLRYARPALTRVDRLASLARHESAARGCDKEPLALDACTWQATGGSSGTVFLVGDSNAEQYSEAVTGAAAQLGLDTVVTTMSACPVADFQLIRDGKPSSSCQDYVATTLEHLLARRPRTVVIAAASEYYINRKQFAFQTPGTTTPVVSPAEKAKAWQEGVGRIATRLRDAGIDVVLVHQTPRLGEWDPNVMAPLRLLGPPDWWNTTIDRQSALDQRSLAHDAVDAAATASGARTLDLFDDLCPGPTCSAYRDGILWYRDSGHISVAASKRLTDRFVAALDR